MNNTVFSPELAFSWYHRSSICLFKYFIYQCFTHQRCWFFVFVFLPTSKTNVAPLVAISSPWRMCALRKLAFCMFAFLPSLRRRDCLTHLFIFVSPTNHTFPDTQESSNGTRNAWTNGVLIGEATGPGLKGFLWVAWPGVHSCQHFNGWLGLNILAHFHQTTCTFCTAVRVLQCFTNERCCKYLAHNWFNHEPGSDCPWVGVASSRSRLSWVIGCDTLRREKGKSQKMTSEGSCVNT